MMQQRDEREVFYEWLREHKGVFFKVVRAYASTERVASQRPTE
jgi:hypothetical protein